MTTLVIVRPNFLKKNSEALEKFKEFKASAEAELGIKIKALRTDRGGEYLSDEFKSYLESVELNHVLLLLTVLSRMVYRND